MKGAKRTQFTRSDRINNEINAAEVRLTGFNGEQIGIVSLQEALKRAEVLGVDLVEISPNAEPPVCRIMNYGKFVYEKSKSSKEQKKKQKIVHIKEIKFRPGTDEGDYKIKLRNLIKFLEEGDKTKVTLRFRGREMAHQQIGMEILNRIRKDLCEDLDLAVIESFPAKVEGRQIIMMLAPKKNRNIH
ncbi:translation initiation factor IF-3 [Candidatus Pantoea edessiphila]|uniref:Translation initiation factor IF-3 n=1 Tax=Candidatus Pantoea edessiphila TaxID=2044610 RepID=A0A2P5SWX6_9GAMM|nr:translation initiation factor IF-3 [Candidatus Pantoea edessiphila]PPI86813.1 translation initiation factor IF-3 [Candidatus Pantoea edessiphila]